MAGLVIKEVTINSSLKAFGFRDGISSGSEISITLDVPSDMTELELKKEIVRKKFTLDTMVARSEMGKGMIPKESYTEICTRAKKTSEEIIHGYDGKEKVGDDSSSS